jgi:hypothetical protein
MGGSDGIVEHGEILLLADALEHIFRVRFSNERTHYGQRFQLPSNGLFLTPDYLFGFDA